MDIARTPYTYLIGWSQLDKWYYGVRHANYCHPDDLWVTYFSSSKYVKEFRQLHGEPDVIQVRKTFSSAQEAVNWECKVLRRIRCRDLFLNKMFGGVKSIIQTVEIQIKKSNKLRGLKRTPAQNAASSLLRKGIKTGRTHSAETKEKMAEAHRGKPKTRESINKRLTSMEGYTHSAETRAKMSESHKGKPSPHKGRKHSDEARAKMRAAHANRSNHQNKIVGGE